MLCICVCDRESSLRMDMDIALANVEMTGRTAARVFQWKDKTMQTRWLSLHFTAIIQTVLLVCVCALAHPQKKIVYYSGPMEANLARWNACWKVLNWAWQHITRLTGTALVKIEKVVIRKTARTRGRRGASQRHEMVAYYVPLVNLKILQKGVEMPCK